MEKHEIFIITEFGATGIRYVIGKASNMKEAQELYNEFESTIPKNSHGLPQGSPRPIFLTSEEEVQEYFSS